MWARRGVRGWATRAAEAPDAVVVAALIAFTALCESIQMSSPSHGIGDVTRSTVGAWAFGVSGLAARRRQPDNRTGALLLLVGFALLAEDIQTSHTAVIVTVGELFRAVSGPAMVWLVLAFPDGRLDRGRDRAVVLGTAAVAFANGVVWLFGSPETLTNVPWSGYSRLLDVTSAAMDVALAAAVLCALDHVRGSSRPARRVLTPFMAVAAVLGAAGLADAGSHHGSSLHTVAVLGDRITMPLLAVAFLVGLVRLDVARADVVHAVAALGPDPSLADLRTSVAKALGDPALRVLRRATDRTLVDESGESAPPPPPSAAVTPLVSDHADVGVLVHDPALRQDQRLMDAVTTVLAETLARQRVLRDAEDRAAQTRVRIERDLHDGAQQRLAAAALRIDALLIAEQDDAHRGALEGIRREVIEATQELRLIARGSPPALLAEQGLDAALRDLADRATCISLSGSVGPGVPLATAATAYYVAAEGLTNALRHSGASAIGLHVSRRNGTLVLSVADNGRGGALGHDGSGLSGLDRRVARAGGVLRVDSPVGVGTTLSVELPIAEGTDG